MLWETLDAYNYGKQMQHHTHTRPTYLCAHVGDALGRDVSGQHVAAQVRVLLVFQVGDAAPQPALVLHICRLELLVDEWAPGRESRN